MRKSLRTILLGGVSFLLLTSTGFAADQIVDVPAGFNWSGFYVGAGGGFGAFGSGGDALAPFGELGGGGGFGELTAGYDHMLTDRILLGGFIDAHLGSMKAEVKLGGLPFLKLTSKYGFDVGARLGYLLNDSTLGYVLGGYAWQRIEASDPGFGLDEHENMDGYVLGVGMETAVRDNWSIKTEYRYTRYDSVSFTGIAGAEFDPYSHTFHIAANYRFGSDGTVPAVASPAYDWSGFYVGGSIGAGQIVNDTSLLAGIFEFDGLSGDGIFGELSAGYDHDFGSFVAGVMVDANYSSIKANVLGTDLKSDYGFDILGRIGMKVNPSTLAYVLGGYSRAHFKLDTSAFGGIGGNWSGNGFSVGGGLETAISRNITAGIEYRYSQFESEDFGTGINSIEVKPSLHTVRIGLKYKFN
jgi:outer membrane immunogenic protein